MSRRWRLSQTRSWRLIHSTEKNIQNIWSQEVVKMTSTRWCPWSNGGPVTSNITTVSPQRCSVMPSRGSRRIRIYDQVLQRVRASRHILPHRKTKLENIEAQFVTLNQEAPASWRRATCKGPTRPSSASRYLAAGSRSKTYSPKHHTHQIPWTERAIQSVANSLGKPKGRWALREAT